MILVHYMTYFYHAKLLFTCSLNYLNAKYAGIQALVSLLFEILLQFAHRHVQQWCRHACEINSSAYCISYVAFVCETGVSKHLFYLEVEFKGELQVHQHCPHLKTTYMLILKTVQFFDCDCDQ